MSCTGNMPLVHSSSSHFVAFTTLTSVGCLSHTYFDVQQYSTFPCSRTDRIARDVQTRSKRAAAALQLATQQAESGLDTNVAAEAAAMQIECQHWISAQSKPQKTFKDAHHSHCSPAEYQHTQPECDSHDVSSSHGVQSVSNGPGCDDAGHLQASVVPSISADLTQNGSVLLTEAGTHSKAAEQLRVAQKGAETSPVPNRYVRFSAPGKTQDVALSRGLSRRAR